MNVYEFIMDEYGLNERLDMPPSFIQVRGAALAKRLFQRQLRTRKNDYKAVAWDDLGNVRILDRAGNSRLLLPSEYKGA